ncbi:hypothetical protein D3C81_1435610 [compost metagenome]
MCCASASTSFAEFRKRVSMLFAALFVKFLSALICWIIMSILSARTRPSSPWYAFNCGYCLISAFVISTRRRFCEASSVCNELRFLNSVAIALISLSVCFFVASAFASASSWSVIAFLDASIAAFISFNFCVASSTPLYPMPRRLSSICVS